MKTPRRIATLTQKENKAWEFAFSFHREESKSDLQADKLAWRDLILEFPRLKNFDGCC
jgi:hypothetical protein